MLYKLTVNSSVLNKNSDYFTVIIVMTKYCCCPKVWSCKQRHPTDMKEIEIERQINVISGVLQVPGFLPECVVLEIIVPSTSTGCKEVVNMRPFLCFPANLADTHRSLTIVVLLVIDL